MQNKINILYDKEEAIRLDKYLAEMRIQELYSRTFIERLINEDRILVNNIPVKKSYLLIHGDEISINLPDPEPWHIVPQKIELDIVYEDEQLAVINKAPGMIVHPGYGNPDNTLVNAMLYHWGNNLSTGREANRPGIVHRLDRGTSGLMIIAKDDATQSRLSDMFAHREVKKTYLAITTGIPDPGEDAIESCIARSNTNPRKMCVADEGRWALTIYKIIKYFHFFSLVKIQLETGRMHQIRVHFAERNIPILGDLLYNTRKQVHSIVPENMKKKVTELLTTHLMRQALHSWRLEFTNPITGMALDIKVDPPADFLHTLAWLDKYFAIDTDGMDIKSLLMLQDTW
ncbi:MAG: RluA family pseudouridine synthase [Candidatus Cloacimonadaceae bacterium]|nr:RluA family pseudouridine synthase [Candidatus Cloacimonadaceae bacterium]MDP3114279.1 RluA family pseudouridine synthase [Candidatus Cloacimonadaceae bacterium]